MKCFFYLTFFAIIAVNAAEKLKVSIYFESLCPSSMRFFTRKLYPNYPVIAKHIDLELIPFGFATAEKSGNDWTFDCQHGSDECYLNKVYSAVIATSSIDDSLEFINCAFPLLYSATEASLESCAHKSNISWEDVKELLSNGKADDLLAENGVKTHSVQPKINFVPTVIFNDNYDRDVAIRALGEFLEVVCGLLDTKPYECEIFNNK